MTPEPTHEQLVAEAMTNMRLQYKQQVQKQVCANADIQLKENSLEFTVTNCGGMKRNGSKYCQECSDKHNSNGGNTK